MSGKYILTVLVFSALCGFAEAQTHVVVLKNGSTMSGKVANVGDQFEIRTNQHNRILINSSQVDFVCKTMVEAFDVKYADTDPNDVTAQKALFFWALRNRLHEKAQQQLNEIQLLKIEAAELERLHRQLLHAIEQARDAEQSKHADQAKSSPLVPRTDVVQSVGEYEFSPVPSLGAVSAEVENERPEDRYAELQARMEMKRKVDQVTKEFAGEFVSKYKRQIEPNLIEGCYAAGCHNQDQPKMPLFAMGRFKDVPKQMSRRNLYEVMQLVDRKDPLDSQLFKSATEPHAGMRRPIFGEEDVQYSNLKRWLSMLADRETLVRYQQEDAAEVANESTPTQPPSSIEDPNLELPGEIRQVTADIPDSDLPSIPDLTPRSKVFEPKDPFDPEIFNRKYRKYRK